MSKKSAIEWTESIWNPISGCSRVTEGCSHCYAFALHDRRHTISTQHQGHWSSQGKPMPVQYALPFSTIQLLPDRLEQPLRVKRPQRIFVNSMSDLFHSQVPDEYIQQVFAVMVQAHWHTFQILTKRVNRLKHLAPSLPWPANVWMGVSIESDLLTVRADALRTVPAAVRFLSCEPLLGPLPSLDLAGIQWVIVGGESGPDARPMEVAWATDLRDRCVAAGVTYFFKQNGGRTPKAGGRLLEGREWNELPMLSGAKVRGEEAEQHFNPTMHCSEECSWEAPSRDPGNNPRELPAFTGGFAEQPLPIGWDAHDL